MSMLPSMKTIDCGPGKTKQKVGMEHDINKLVARFKREGKIPRMNTSGQIFADDDGKVVDLTSIGDYQDCMQRIVLAREAFDVYPSAIRRHFGNDVMQFVSFVDKLKSDPDAQRTAVALGILEVQEPEPLKPPKEDKPDPDKK